MDSPLVILKKIHTRGIFWFIARLLQEAERGVSMEAKIIKPVMSSLYYLFIRPTNKCISFFKKKIVDPDTLYFFYDLEVAPVTFDFSWALVLAEQERKRANLSKVHVVFVPGKNNGLREESIEYEKCVDLYARKWRLTELLHAMCDMLPSCSGSSFCSTREEAMTICQQAGNKIFPKRYSTTFPIAHSTSHALINDHEIMALRATNQALRYMEQWQKKYLNHRKLITITLRYSTYQPERNSNLLEWLAFARKLDQNEYFVVFVPDTENVFSDDYQLLEEFFIFREVAWNLHLRMALYQVSFLNLGVDNGVMGLCWLNSNCRYITFKMHINDRLTQPTTKMSEINKHDIKSSHGFNIGDSLPFSNQLQKWIWDEDKFDSIFSEFNLIAQQL